MNKHPITARTALGYSRDEVLAGLKTRGIDPVKAGDYYNKQEGIDLLNKVLLLIADEPARFDMNQWIDDDDNNGPMCGTVGCLAGWISIVRPPENFEVFTQLSEVGHEHSLVKKVVKESPISKGVKGTIFSYSYDEDSVTTKGTDMFIWGDVIIAANARDQLGLTDGDARLLFNVDNWPEELRYDYEYETETGSIEGVRILSERLSHWVESGE